MHLHYFVEPRPTNEMPALTRFSVRALNYNDARLVAEPLLAAHGYPVGTHVNVRRDWEADHYKNE